MILIVGIFITSCHHSPTGNKPIAGWEKVEAFGDEPILGLYTNSDSTSFHVVSRNFYGYKTLGNSRNEFQVRPLTYPINYDEQLGFSKSLPYFADDKCFYCNDDGTVMYIYDIFGGNWDKLGELNIHDFVADSLQYEERFGSSHWLNLPNHITYAGDNKYYITTEAHLPYKYIYEKYANVLVTIDFSNKITINEIYRSEGVIANVSFSCVMSSDFVQNYFLQDFGHLNDCHRALSLDSSDYIPVTGRYPIRDRFIFDNYLVGIGDGVIMRSFDYGLNWEEWLSLNHPFTYTSIADKTILFYWNSIGQWHIEDDLTVITMLETDPLLGLRTNYIYEFNGTVYAATNMGLYSRPVSTFFTPRPDNNKEMEPQIKGEDTENGLSIR
jgi:hypothetical protein